MLEHTLADDPAGRQNGGAHAKQLVRTVKAGRGRGRILVILNDTKILLKQTRIRKTTANQSHTQTTLKHTYTVLENTWAMLNIHNQS
jgi:hypothetical protein